MKNNNLSREFSSNFNVQEINNLVFGYLCFDHTDVGYFREPYDIEMGYIYADILSLYFLSRFMYVDQSSTMDKVKLFLRD
ncbi:MAG: hypothetical protein GY714_04695 [Desulfobacterales bacterium]|nr:hypothetical protein [Desulfobacterales bacterium]MCP4160701.1 hypothetical protein [Deltaproteobacteria bacterium]